MLSLVDSIFNSVLQMKRLRCKELKKHAQGQSQTVTEPGPPDGKVQILSHGPRLDVARLPYPESSLSRAAFHDWTNSALGSLCSPGSGALCNLSTRLPFQYPLLMASRVVHSNW